MNRTSLLALMADVSPQVSFFIAGRITDFVREICGRVSITAPAGVLSWQPNRRLL